MKRSLKRLLRRLHQIGTCWIAEPTLNHLESIRKHELSLVVDMLPPRAKILEIGAGTGWQAKALEELGYEVCAVDVPSSKYTQNRVWNVTEYDGKKLPYDDNSFDIVFSSNVLEHIPHIGEFLNEIHRVIRTDGRAIHILPSSTWRIWTNLTHVLKCWSFPTTHGEHAANALAEILYFRRGWWVRRFYDSGWTVMAQHSNALFYTGHSVIDCHLSVAARTKLSRILGSSCNIFVLAP